MASASWLEAIRRDRNAELVWLLFSSMFGRDLVQPTHRTEHAPMESDARSTLPTTAMTEVSYIRHDTLPFLNVVHDDLVEEHDRTGEERRSPRGGGNGR